MSDLSDKMSKMTEDVGGFIDNYTGVLQSNTVKVAKITEDFKKRKVDGPMNEPAPLPIEN